MPFKEALPASFHIQGTARCQKALCVSTPAAPHVAQVRLPGGVQAICQSVKRLSGHARGKELAHTLVLGRIRVCIHACVRAVFRGFVRSKGRTEGRL